MSPNEHVPVQPGLLYESTRRQWSSTRCRLVVRVVTEDSEVDIASHPGPAPCEGADQDEGMGARRGQLRTKLPDVRLFVYYNDDDTLTVLPVHHQY